MCLPIVQFPHGAGEVHRQGPNVELDGLGNTNRQFSIKRTGDDDRDSFFFFFLCVSLQLWNQDVEQQMKRTGERVKGVDRV